MASKTGGGIVSTLGKVVVFLVVAGLIIALLRVFNWDPFGIIDWAWNLVSGVVIRISDFFTGNKTFQDVVSTPGVALFLPWK